MPTQPPASVQVYASPRPNDACSVVAEFAINHHQSFRAELVVRAGKPMVSISRLKNTPNGARRTGQAFEFGAHRTAAIASLLSKVLHALDALNLKEVEARATRWRHTPPIRRVK